MLLAIVTLIALIKIISIGSLVVLNMKLLETSVISVNSAN